MKVKDWGERRWYVNGQGQTFAVIEGPVEFRMGSPPTETERDAGNEARSGAWSFPAGSPSPPRRSRSSSCSGSERADTGVDRYQLSPSFLNKYSPDPGRAHGSVSTGTWRRTTATG